MKNKFLAQIATLGIRHEVITHNKVVTMADVSRELSIPFSQMVKTIVLVDKRKGNLMLAAIPGDKRLSRAKTAKAFGLSRSRVDLAHPQLVREALGIEIGAIPPFGLGTPVVFDQTICSETVYCGIGERTLTLKVDLTDLLLVANPKSISDLSE